MLLSLPVHLNGAGAPKIFRKKHQGYYRDK